MPGTKHHIIRLSDEHWHQLAEKFRSIVSSERKPKNANPDSDWQITEGLRMIADGELQPQTSKSARPRRSVPRL
jgi:hypothetical protein